MTCWDAYAVRGSLSTRERVSVHLRLGIVAVAGLKGSFGSCVKRMSGSLDRHQPRPQHKRSGRNIRVRVLSQSGGIVADMQILLFLPRFAWLLVRLLGAVELARGGLKWIAGCCERQVSCYGHSVVGIWTIVSGTSATRPCYSPFGRKCVTACHFRFGHALAPLGSLPKRPCSNGRLYRVKVKSRRFPGPIEDLRSLASCCL